MAKKQKSGLYRSKVKIGIGPDGKDIVKYISGKTKRELEQARQEVTAYYIDGKVAANDQLFGAYAVNWYKLYKEPYVRAATRSSYRNALNVHLLPAFAERNLRAIRPDEIQAYVNTLSGCSKSHADKIIMTLQQIFKRAHHDGILDRDPTAFMVRPKTTQGERRALTPDERERVLTVCSQHPEGLLFLLLYYTGMRRSEALGLQWQDVDMASATIHVRRGLTYVGTPTIGPLKTTQSERGIPIPAPLLGHLKNVQGIGEAHVITSPGGKPLSESTLQRRVARLVEACDIPDLTCYIFRHNYMTMLDEAGVSPSTAQTLGGHADYNTTLKYYTHIGDIQLAKAREEISNVF